MDEQTVQDFRQNHAEGGMLGGHLGNARKMGLFRYLRLKEFTHHNTDGPANPYALVYDRKRIAQDFPSFQVTRTYKRFMHAPPLPVHGLPGQSLLGRKLRASALPSAVKGGARAIRRAHRRAHRPRSVTTRQALAQGP
jgi:hypothetical protein